MPREQSVRIILRTITSMVPQWYIADHGTKRNFGSEKLTYCCPIGLSTRLRKIEKFVTKNFSRWLQLPQTSPLSGRVALIREAIALEWLRISSPDLAWEKIIDFFNGLYFRTYENSPVVLNVIISRNEGKALLIDDNVRKFLDPLAGSRQVFLRVDRNLRISDYGEIPWDHVGEARGYKFSPEFLQPFASILRDGEFSVHQTRKGDLIIMDRMGLLATKRKGKWCIYDSANLSNCLKRVLGDFSSPVPTRTRLEQRLHQRVGANLYEIILDLSYKRHGALLIYDPEGRVLGNTHRQQIGSLDNSKKNLSARSLIASIAQKIQISHEDRQKRKKRLFLELASIDGALIFDANRILDFGAMVRPHLDAGSHHGTRTTAAFSAYLWGGIPIKISSDGDVTILFRSFDTHGSCQAKIHFL